MARKAASLAKKGGDTVDRTVAGILKIREGVADATRRVKRLSEFTQEISKIVGLISQIAELYAVQGYETEILAASIRNSKHIVDAAIAGADIVTCPLDSILGLLKHPLTDIGLAKFLADHQKAAKK